LKIDDAFAGRRGKCPRCGQGLVVPAAAPAVNQPKRAVAPSEVPLAALVGRPRHDDVEEWIDMTSMVDIVFFLLIFFMVTSLNSEQASIDMPVPQTRQTASGAAAGRKSVEDFESDDEFIIVRIDADDTVWVEDAEALTPTDVVVKLRDTRDNAGGKQAATKLLVLADGDSHHGTAVMVLDAGREAGIEDVRLAVQEET
jgi:biopolymer transport protein ExbD